MTVTTMRELIKKAYPHSETWKEKVRRMPETQVTAIYFRFKRQGKI